MTCVRTASVCRRHGARRSCGDAERREGLAAGACKATGGAQPRGGAHVAMARGAIASTQRRSAACATDEKHSSPPRLHEPTRHPPRPHPRADPTGSGFRPAPGFALPPLSAVARVRGTPQSPRPAADPRERATPDGRNLRERAKLNGGRSPFADGLDGNILIPVRFYDGRDRAVSRAVR